MIEPRILKGFRDSLPQQEITRQNLISEVQKIFRSFGFVPIDTPAIEYSEVLLGKGGGETDKQMFRFRDNGDRDVSLRFDLTVPLARYVAANKDKLTFPFKRYHIGKVWRGEKPQKGRFREFYQCDFDIIGTDSIASDFEILLMIHTCLSEMNIGEFRILVSHRGIINTFLESISLSDKSDEILRIIDKLSKIGRDGVAENLKECGIDEDGIKKILNFLSLTKNGFSETLGILSEQLGKTDDIARLEELFIMLKDCGIESSFLLDTSVTRGLDYYTGIVYETQLVQLPQIGSICSGGRYDNLAGLYTKDRLSGVGSCIGLDRLIAALEETAGSIVNSTGSADILIASGKIDTATAQNIAVKFRKSGIKTDCYAGTKDMGHQFSYAEKNGIRFVICNKTDKDSYSVKEIATRQMYEDISFDEIVKKVK